MKVLFSIFIFLMFQHSGWAADNPCQADQEKFCAGKEGMDRAKCMKKHSHELSKECQNFRDQKMQSAKEVRAACKADRKAFCGGKKPKEVMNCMQENFDKLSETCKEEINKFRK